MSPIRLLALVIIVVLGVLVIAPLPRGRMELAGVAIILLALDQINV